MNKATKNKLIHWAVILGGMAFLLIGTFSKALWFDEAFSVSITRVNFFDIFRISSDYANPPLYYLALRIMAYIFGGSVLTVRLFSVVCTGIIAVLGFTHIRKDFGRKCGLIFSILVYVMPFSYKYGVQAANYSFTILLVTLAIIYGYRVVQYFRENETMHITTAIAFVAYSVLAMYSNYGAILAVVIINVALLLRIFWINNNIDFDQALNNSPVKIWGILAAIQCVLAIPSVVLFFGVVGKIGSMNVQAGFNFAFALYGVLIWAISYAFARVKFEFNIKTIMYPVMGILIVGSVVYAFYVITTSYDKSNSEWKSVLEENMQDNDMFVSTNGNVVVIGLEYDKHATFLHIESNERTGSIYNAFVPYFYATTDRTTIENYFGRMWVVDSDDLYEDLCKFGNVKTLMEFDMNMAYYGNYNSHKLRLIERTKE